MAITSPSLRIQIPRRTTRNIGWCNRTSGNQPNACITHADFGEKHADAHSACDLYTRWDDFDEPLTHTDQREEDEDETLDENGCERETVAYAPGAMVADNLVGKVGVETHAWTGGT